VGFAENSHIYYPEIRPSGSQRRDGKLHAQAHRVKECSSFFSELTWKFITK
jgi:hypothetical protein